MEWINIHVSFLDNPAFIGAAPVDRATWLCLLRYCVGQENGGVIAGAAEWGDRRWQQVARVTLREVKRPSGLWSWENGDLILRGYPAEKEAIVRRKRAVAHRNGAMGGRPPEEPKSETDGKPTSVNSENQNTSFPLPFPSLPLPFHSKEFAAAWADWWAYRRERHLPAPKLRSYEAQLRRLAGWGEAGAIRSIRDSIANNWQGLFEPKEPRSGRRAAALPPELNRF